MKNIEEYIAWLGATAAVFLLGSWGVWRVSRYFPNSHGHIPGAGLLHWVGVTFAVGSGVGLAFGGAGALGAKVLGKPLRTPLTAGYFLGLNLTALLLLWVLPNFV